MAEVTEEVTPQAEPEEVKPLPALYFHCESVYVAMVEHASVEKFHILDPDSLEGLIYEGFLTRLITSEVGLAVPYYTGVMKELRRMGCVEQLRRGGSTTPSRWVLHFAPTEELFGRPENPITQRHKIQSVRDQQIKDLTSRMAEVETRLDDLFEVMVALDRKLENRKP